MAQISLANVVLYCVLSMAFYTVVSTTLFAVVSGAFNDKNSTKGVCHLEVPTIDLLPEDQRHTAEATRGNGSRPGYSKLQICCSGYKLQSFTKFHCVPQCDNDCENGNCTAPNVCECHRGFVKGPEGKCIPTCPKGCLNGICAFSGACSCNVGYEPEPKGQYCVSVCKNGCGIGGDCVAPNECRCKPGFTKNNLGICTYHCQGGCGGGECIGPNQCSCARGYEKVGATCSPKCTRGCRNGECTAPDKCTCKAGWTLDPAGSICDPVCSKPCLNGECTGPNQCTCKPGYAKDPSSFDGTRCIADCPGGCENGVCSAPNFCICNPGFVKQARGSNVCVRRVRRNTRFHPELIPEQF